MIMGRVQPRSRITGCASAAAWSALLLAIQLLWLIFATPSLQAQTFTVLHTFTGKGDGEFPIAGLLRGNAGSFYGTTDFGGSFDRGTVFEIAAHGKETILHSFWGGDGTGPGALIRDRTGSFYGITAEGGTPEGGACIHGCGAVFKLDKAGKESVLYAFTGGADGSDPEGALVRDEEGNLYGTTALGGKQHCDYSGDGCGIVFKVDKNGKETVLHTFAGPPDGEQPNAGLVRDKAGNLYGTTVYGGASTACGYGCGTVFKVDPKGNETVLYSFAGGADGSGPGAPLFLDGGGNIYGTAGGGGSPCNCGVVFKLDTTGSETVLYAFKGSPDGAHPQGGLLRGKSGSLYGVTYDGGSANCSGYGCGTVFKLDASGNETVLYNFTGGNDGEYPNGSLITDSSGNLYGTTYQGGDSSCHRGYSCGVVFKLTP
jgi:uncharacterized repeat protein (TIGR03803 family)